MTIKDQVDLSQDEADVLRIKKGAEIKDLLNELVMQHVDNCMDGIPKMLRVLIWRDAFASMLVSMLALEDDMIVKYFLKDVEEYVKLYRKKHGIKQRIVQ